jgi:hypothetical protein
MGTARGMLGIIRLPRRDRMIQRAETRSTVTCSQHLVGLGICTNERSSNVESTHASDSYITDAMKVKPVLDKSAGGGAYSPPLPPAAQIEPNLTGEPGLVGKRYTKLDAVQSCQNATSTVPKAEPRRGICEVSSLS